jgi:hypothetical protein
MMLIGDGPLSLPRYDPAHLPAVVLVRCPCGMRFAVFTGTVVIDDGCELARASAESRGFVFVDARAEPFRLCDCGTLIDLTASDGAALVM